MKKFMVIITLSSIGMISTAFANDCNILIDSNATTTIDKNIDTMISSYTHGYWAKYTNVLPIEAFKRALINLKFHCCTKEIQKSCSSDDIKNIQITYPESAFLFDHLIDIAMRRLDGITWLAYNISPDPTALERRTKITEIAKSANGTPANKIEETYTGYWTLHINTTKKLDTVLIWYKSNNIEVLSLGDKYATICELMTEIYNGTINERGNIWATTETSSFLSKCKNLVQERVKRETSYTKILMVQKSSQLFDETTKAYTKKYFVEEKLSALWTLISKVKDIFKVIVKQAPVSQSCNQ